MSEKRDFQTMIDTLQCAGYVVLKAKSYYAAQERLRNATVLLDCERQAHGESLAWGSRAWGDERKAWDRASFLYGECLRRGATHDDLRQPDGQIKDEPKPPLKDVLVPYV